MYEAWFGFREAPFRLTPATRGFYSNASYERACTMLLYGLRERKGLLVLTGEVGTGKTTVLRRVMDQVEPDTRFVLVFNATWNFDELLEFTCDELGLPPKQGRVARIQGLNGFLLSQARAGGTTALLIDEAHGLTDDALEQLRLLSNLETGIEKLLQIALVGQPELEARLALPQLRQLTQRIAVRCRLEPLRPSEVKAFVTSRLATAGYEGEPLFTERAFLRIAGYSRGIPRLINVIADNALLHCFARSRREVTAEVVDDVAQQMRIQTPELPEQAPAEAIFERTFRTVEGRLDPDERRFPENPPRRHHLKTTLLVAFVGIALVAGILARYGSFPERLRNLFQHIDPFPGESAAVSLLPEQSGPAPAADTGPASADAAGAAGAEAVERSTTAATPVAPPRATRDATPPGTVEATAALDSTDRREPEVRARKVSSGTDDPAVESTGHPGAPEGRVVRIWARDTVYRIARDTYSTPERHLGMDLIHEFNRHIDNLDLVFPGQDLRLPPFSRETLMRPGPDGSVRVIVGASPSKTTAEKRAAELRTRVDWPVSLTRQRITDALHLYRIEVHAPDQISARQAWQELVALGVLPKTGVPRDPELKDRHSGTRLRHAIPETQPGSRSPAMALLARRPPWLFGRETSSNAQ